MLHFSKWKMISILFAVFLGALFALPNVIPQSTLASFPDWLPRKQVALGLDFKIDQAVTRNLVEHMVEEGHAAGEFRLAAAVQIDLDDNLGFLGIACNLRLPCHDVRVPEVTC